MPNRENQNTDIVNPSEMPEELLHVENWEDTVCALQQKYCYKRSFLAEKLCNMEQLKYQQRDPSKRRTIAAYYHAICNGGAEHVVTMLCNIWARMKDEKTGEPCFRVLVVTDEEKAEEKVPDYPLVSQVEHLYIPKYETKTRGDYRPRFRKWQEIITEYKVDAVISSEWVFPGTIWDMLAIKGHPSHLVFIFTFIILLEWLLNIPMI